MFRKKTRGQVIAAELQEGFSHIGTAMTEAGRAAADELAPRIAAAREAAAPALGAAQLAVAPKVAAAVAVTAPAVASAREAIGPRVEAAQKALGPRVEAAREVADARFAAAVENLGPRVHAARENARPALTSAVAATTAAASKAAADLAPRVEAAQRAAQKTLATEVLPRVVAAREAVGPALESARGSLASGVETALGEFEHRREELVAAAGATAAKASGKVKKQTKKQKRAAARTAAKAKKRTARKVTPASSEPSSRRWTWLALFAAVGAVAFAVVRRRGEADSWTPAPTGDGPVPSYREDPVPSSPSSSEFGTTVSSATWEAGDSAPAESDMGLRDAQNVAGDGADGETDPTDTAPEPFTSGGSDDPGPTAGPSGSGQA
ncbi:hypothetical protein [Trujillonella endophytica]|uniref:Uncharacterized protein n=1 Tax=Trujillonella endophytica TaxID=673521 RepID=A0A1H8VPJ6_9ACTN|nr:hypothetical protein [Trujillella endophytica]SEP17331.1 hypothetical protein SAMN05660991_03697 [Trujillella endophytica]